MKKLLTIFFTVYCLNFLGCEYLSQPLFIYDLKVMPLDSINDAEIIKYGEMKIGFRLKPMEKPFYMPISISNHNRLIPYAIESTISKHGRKGKSGGIVDALYKNTLLKMDSSYFYYVIMPDMEYIDTTRLFFNLNDNFDKPMNKIGILNMVFDDKNNIKEYFFSLKDAKKKY